MIEAIHERKQELLDFVGAERDMKMKILKDQAHTCTSHLQKTTSLLYFCVEVLKESDPASFLQVGTLRKGVEVGMYGWEGATVVSINEGDLLNVLIRYDQVYFKLARNMNLVWSFESSSIEFGGLLKGVVIEFRPLLGDNEGKVKVHMME